MEINSFTTSQVLPLPRTNTSVNFGKTSSTTSSDDQAVLNTSADTFASYVQDASNMPDVRSEVVDAYKARISSNNYPGQDVLEGLSRQIGGSIVAAAMSGAAYPGSE